MNAAVIAVRSSTSSFSRSWARVRASRRKTCIWEMPTSSRDLRLGHVAEEAQQQDPPLTRREVLRQQLEGLTVLDTLQRFMFGSQSADALVSDAAPGTSPTDRFLKCTGRNAEQQLQGLVLRTEWLMGLAGCWFSRASATAAQMSGR